MAIDVKKATEGKDIKMTEEDLDNFFNSDSFKELAEAWEAQNTAIEEERKKLTNDDILYFAHKALAEGVAVVRDDSEEENIAKSDALYAYASQKVMEFFNLEELYSGSMFNRTVNIPFTEFVDKDVEFGEELNFVEWFVPLEVEGQTLILQAIYGQGEAFFVFETVARSREYCGENAWQAITKTYPISDIFTNA